MNVIVDDKLSIFIQGMSFRLNKVMPEIRMKVADDLYGIWRAIESMPDAVLLLDGDVDSKTFVSTLDELSLANPNNHIVVMMNSVNKKQLELYLAHRAVAIVPKNLPAEMVIQVLKMAAAGMVCFPERTFFNKDDNKPDVNKVANLSDRQLEVLELIAAGKSNKQISRSLNISAGTVKSHLESIFRRLNVNNRTQAAIIFSSND
ncbi:response regulator transcription factor [Pectobacterium carotovorum]|nr:response regulator transcription factor [Pectobacterium carotovorum]